MSELCLECFNKLSNTDLKKRHVILGYAICENCGEMKKCVTMIIPDINDFILSGVKVKKIKRKVQNK